MDEEKEKNKYARELLTEFIIPDLAGVTMGYLTCRLCGYSQVGDGKNHHPGCEFNICNECKYTSGKHKYDCSQYIDIYQCQECGGYPNEHYHDCSLHNCDEFCTGCPSCGGFSTHASYCRFHVCRNENCCTRCEECEAIYPNEHSYRCNKQWS